MTAAEITFDQTGDALLDRKQEIRKVFWALLAALLIHLVVAFTLAVLGGAFSPALPVEEKPVELTIVDLATPAPVAPKNPAFMEADESKQAPEPKDKTFESNANSLGASQLPATGEMPLPSQEGKDRPWVDLESHQYSLPNQGAQPQPSAVAQETPQPSPAASETPPPDQLALLTKSPTPPPVTESTPAQPQQPKSSYRAQKEQTRIRGNISNRGISSVNALGTPLGRYQKILFEAIGSRWYAAVERQLDMFGIGTARISFRVDREGHIKNLKVIENSSNELFVNFCVQSVQEAQLPPMADDLAANLPPDGLEVELPFTIYAN
jgi:outer membrane biosynthesis protein TonB